jgi:hypothetical protein
MTSCIYRSGTYCSHTCRCSVRKAGWLRSQPPVGHLRNRTGHYHRSMRLYYCPLVSQAGWNCATTGFGPSPRIPLPPAPPRPPRPAHASAADTSGRMALAEASHLLEAISRSGSVRDLRDSLQEARAQGCLTSAHSLAALIRLGALVRELERPLMRRSNERRVMVRRCWYRCCSTLSSSLGCTACLLCESRACVTLQLFVDPCTAWRCALCCC